MNWNDFIQNTNWNFFEVVVGIFAIITSVLVTYHIFFRGRKKKSLSYEILTDTELISVHKEAKERVEILFDGKPAKNVSLLVVRIINNGNVPITSSDFEIPLSLNFEEKVNILSAEVNKSSEKSLKPVISLSANKIILEPILLNSKDSFEIKILINNYDNPFEIESRIIGVKEIREYEEVSSILLMPAIIYLIIGLIFIGFYYFEEIDRPQEFPFPFSIFMGLIALIFSVILFLYRYISPKKYKKIMERVFIKLRRK
jgi:hypothetical protein